MPSLIPRVPPVLRAFLIAGWALAAVGPCPASAVAATAVPKADAFAFGHRTGVTPGSLVVSNAVAIGGIAGAVPIAVTGGQYSIGCNGTFTRAAGTISPGETVCVRHLAPLATNATTASTLTVDGVAAVFRSTTGAAPGTTPPQALSGFMFSTEFRNFSQAIFGATAVRAEIDTVTDFYRGLLARLPDSGGFTFWLARFRAAQCLGGNAVNAEVESISSLFAGSAEYASRARSNAQFVGDLFNAFLRRGGDLAGVQFWINEIASGARTRESVRQAFVASPEFQSRVAAIIGQGCAP